MKTLDISQKDYEFKRPVYDEIRVDPMFRKISRYSVGFQVFKVENDHIEAIPKDQFGTLYDENVYIVYASACKGTLSDQNTITREIKTAVTIERFIHVWLGAHSSSIKSKHAALKIIELDLHLSHTGTQYRESQGFESKRFLAYFKEHGLKILSGSNNKSTAEIPRLYHVVGRIRPLRCLQMKSISWSNFSSGNVMILRTFRIVFVWVGRSSCSLERVHALNVASKFRDSPEIVVVDDGYEQSMTADRRNEWNKLLNLDDRLVQPFVVMALSHNVPLKLYQCKNLNGVLRVEHIKTDAIDQTDFADKCSTFIIDDEKKGIWIWIGRNASTQDKAEGMRHARGYILKRDYPSYYPVCRIIDGHEPIDFTSFFPQWDQNDNSSYLSNRLVLEKFDALTLIQRPELASQMQMIDDGSGEIKVFRIDNEDITDLPKRYGQILFSEHCYIIQYQTAIGHSIKNIIYLWIGQQSRHKDKATGELFLDEMFDHFNENVLQIRIYEGMEPPHFLQLFKGKLIILSGSDLNNGTGPKFPSTFILKVFGNSSYTAKAITVTNKSTYSQTDCYIIKAMSGTTWVWCGNSSTGDTREIAKKIASIIGEPNLVMEGTESEAFYKSVGEKCITQLKSMPRSTNLSLCPSWEKSRVNLYLASLIQGQIILEQIFGFTQKDLAPDNIYLLDVGSIIYVWLGNMVDSQKKKAAWVIALHLISIHPVPRDVTLPVAVTKQNYEPITFWGFFDQWDSKLFDTYKTFDKFRLQMNLSDAYPVPYPRSKVTGNSTSNEFDNHQKYPLNVLRGDTFNLPSYINPLRKEIHLSHDDFVSVFKMDYSEFEALPKWRQTQLKKENKLF